VKSCPFKAMSFFATCKVTSRFGRRDSVCATFSVVRRTEAGRNEN